MRAADPVTPGPRHHRPWLLVALGLLLTGGALLAALALTASLAGAADPPCPDGSPVVGDLGITELTGLARFSMSGDVTLGLERQAQFRTEPRIVSLIDGAASAPIREGDVIIAIDGTLITTREGGRRFANLEPDHAVVLTLRRESRTMQVRVVPVARCGALPAWVETPEPPTPPAPPAAPRAESPLRAPSAPRVWTLRTPVGAGPTRVEAPEAPEAPEAMRALEGARSMAMIGNRGWFGMGIDCEGCHWESLPGDSGVTWVSSEYPTLYSVDAGSPAQRAGLQRGDVLTHIDGVSLLTPEGGRRFGAVKPGQRVRWTYRRDGKLANTVAVAVGRPGAIGVYARSIDEMRDQLKHMAETDEMNAESRRKLEEMAMQMRDREVSYVKQRSQMAGMQRLRYAGSVGDADVEVKGLGNVTVTTDDATGEIVVTTSDATIHIRPSEGTPVIAPGTKAAKPPKPPKH